MLHCGINVSNTLQALASRQFAMCNAQRNTAMFKAVLLRARAKLLRFDGWGSSKSFSSVNQRARIDTSPHH